MMVTLVAAGCLGNLFGWLAATATYRVSSRDRIAASPQDIAKFMTRVVNLEELEEHRRMVRLRMMQAKQRTVRFDGGPSATVHRMRVRRRGIRRDVATSKGRKNL